MREASVQLLLSPGAEETWTQVLRPWFETGRGRLERAYLVVPTRGQAQALKQRCLLEGVALLGVEFLTPGLARKKWAALDDAGRPAIGRELLLLGLRALIARRLAPLRPEDIAWGFWKSLQSDPERALDDFDDLMKGGFRAEDFPLAPLASIFGELSRWVADRGYDLAPLQAEEAGLAARPAGAPRIAGRVLILAPGAELWGEFFNMAAFARRCADVAVVLSAPEFRGRAALDEKWVELWRALLGAEPRTLEPADAAKGCAGVAALWGGGFSAAPDASRASVLVGRTRADEMELVADLVARRLAAGAENIAVVFPAADAAHRRLARGLERRGVPFVDLLGFVGAPPVDVQARRALLAFHEKGGRLEELLALWPLLRAIGATTLSLAEARRACERAFDETQSHAVERARTLWEKSPRAAPLAELVAKLLPVWPEELAFGDALRRFRAVCEALEIEAPACGALDVFAERSPEPYPRAVVLATLASFLPETSPARGAPGRGGFARVTLTTRRRAEGAAWSHLVLVESNAGVWPERREPSCWLTDEQRERLNARGRFGLGLFTSEHRSSLERSGLAALAGDTTEEVVFAASLHDDEEPELRLAPNAWLERVLWARGEGGPGGDLEKAFERAARSAGPAADAGAPGGDAGTARWLEVWNARRDPARPFDEFFLAGDPARVTPVALTARGVEAGVRDPAELWFDSVLGARRVAWEPLVRARRKAIGQRAHELLAAALRPGQADGRGFGEMPGPAEARARLDELLHALRTRWPADVYWDSFHAELAQICASLLDNVHRLPEAGGHVATEATLPQGASLPLGGGRFPVGGRMDLVRLDRPGWAGARVDIVDFKTGGDLALSAARMARDGASLQLGVYLAAALSLGAAAGRVWMVKPGRDEVACLGSEQLDEALALLGRLERFVNTGIYGALTRDRSDYAPSGFVWPLACAPVPEATLRAKFAATFGGEETGAGEEAGDE